MKRLIEDNHGFIERIEEKLRDLAEDAEMFPADAARCKESSAVLFLLGPSCFSTGKTEPCVFFNKRSYKVRQPGDLCFPGGSVSPGFDRVFSVLLRLPLTPMRRWPHRRWWRMVHPDQYEQLSVLFATSLRESLEEMRLNPLGVRFLGPMPAFRLTMFHRSIYPMVGWIQRQRRFHPNWEVERIVRVPLSRLLNPANYALFRLQMISRYDSASPPVIREMPCFRHHGHGDSELLWGATFRMVMSFLGLMFGFVPPDIRGLPVVHRTIDESYIGSAKSETPFFRNHR